MSKKLIQIINMCYKVLVWSLFISNIVLTMYTIRLHKDMQIQRKLNQKQLENTVNQLISKRLTKPLSFKE